MAFATIVSNDKYVDGAIALGVTLRLQSRLVHDGRARIVAMVPSAVSEVSRERLASVGFVVEVTNSSLRGLAPRSWWAMTLDKILLLNLTQYAKVAFIDADVIITHSVDGLFNVDLPTPWWIGGTPRSSGFGTGTMVVRPDAAVADAMVRYTVNAVRNSSDKRGFNTPNLRDGLAFRWFFGPRHKTVSTEGMYHFSGGWKPWYNVKGNMSEIKHLPNELQGSIAGSGPQHLMWWRIYAAAWRWLIMPQADTPQRAAYEAAFAKRWEGVNGTAADYMWVMRSSPFEYLLAFSEVEANAAKSSKPTPAFAEFEKTGQFAALAP